jgi:hypothetical protein
MGEGLGVRVREVAIGDFLNPHNFVETFRRNVSTTGNKKGVIEAARSAKRGVLLPLPLQGRGLGG